MPEVKISALPAAGALDGTETFPVVQGGVTKRTTGLAPASHLTDAAAHSGTLAPAVAGIVTTNPLWLGHRSVTEQGVSAVAADRAVILAPTLAWESTSLHEPNVWFDGTVWNMIYGGGWSVSYIGHATAPDPSGPWTKRADPIIGNGFGGQALAANQSSVFIDDDRRIYCYFNTGSVTGPPNARNLMVADGATPTTLAMRATPALVPAGTADAIVNVSVVKLDGVYHMMFEAKSTVDSKWKIGHATATSPLGPFTISMFPVTSLQQGVGVYGGPFLKMEGRTPTLVFHASVVNGFTPTYLYQAVGINGSFESWNVISGPGATRTGGAGGGITPWVDLVHAEEVDQVADPCLAVGPHGIMYGFWAGMNNPLERGRIMMSRLTNPPPGKTLIQRQVNALAVGDITFVSIPQFYETLELEIYGASESAVLNAAINAQLNGDVGANYDWQTLETTAGTFPSNAQAATSMRVGSVPGASSTAGQAGHYRLQFPGYARTTFRKQMTVLGGGPTNVDGSALNATYGVGQWRNTAAINTIRLNLTFKAGTVATLYGLA